ncbi:hypothetical protein RGU70_13430 [Herbaspirillum sp. RTI4]|nr:hypothetical protein [Herbaspirillum sp. RTI4]MDY7579316.1 hypothetical protein [Herbaspirillum sp. RTI4]MEA9980230.1 hypothetical protein [Herbaspirillum sp. RTI4]
MGRLDAYVAKPEMVLEAHNRAFFGGAPALSPAGDNAGYQQERIT